MGFYFIRRKVMIYLYIRQTVGDYGQWKEAFDIHSSVRQASGATNEMLVLRNVDDTHEVIVLLGWRDSVQARLFIQSVSWQIVRREMGVVGVPEVRFLETAVPQIHWPELVRLLV